MNRFRIVMVFLFQDDIGGFSAQLQGNMLYAFQCFLSYPDAAGSGAGEGNHAHERMDGEGIAYFAAAAGNKVEDAFRETGLIKGFCQEVGGKRRMLTGFQDDRIAHEQRGNDFLDDLPQRIVPGSDAADDADRFPVYCGGSGLFDERYFRCQVDVISCAGILIFHLRCFGEGTGRAQFLNDDINERLFL